jgi:hypothetical protein
MRLGFLYSTIFSALVSQGQRALWEALAAWGRWRAGEKDDISFSVRQRYWIRCRGCSTEENHGGWNAVERRESQRAFCGAA